MSDLLPPPPGRPKSDVLRQLADLSHPPHTPTRDAAERLAAIHGIVTTTLSTPVHNAPGGAEMPMNPIQLLRELQVDIAHGNTDFDEVSDKIDDCLRHDWFAVFFTDADLAADEQDLDFYGDDHKAKAVDAAEFLCGDTTPESVAITTPTGRVITLEPVTDADGVYGHFTVTGD